MKGMKWACEGYEIAFIFTQKGVKMDVTIYYQLGASCRWKAAKKTLVAETISCALDQLTRYIGYRYDIKAIIIDRNGPGEKRIWRNGVKLL